MTTTGIGKHARRRGLLPAARFVPGLWGDGAWTALMAAYAVHVGITEDGGFVGGNTARSALCLVAALGYLLLCRRSVYAYCLLALAVFAATDFYVPLTAAAFALGVARRAGVRSGRTAALAAGVLLALPAGLVGGYRRAAVSCPAVSVDPLLLQCGFPEAAYRSAAAVIAAYALGAYLRRSGEMSALNQRLADERDLHAEQARLRERAHIAGEMHDRLGHHLALTGIYAGALALKASVSPELNRMARVVVDSNRTAAQTLHQVVEVLRRDDVGEGTSAGASAKEMRALVDRARAAGSEVVAPDDWGGFDAMPATARLALCRVLQESVTNIVKHAPGADVTVSLLQEDGGVELTVTNGPVTSAPDAALPAGGFGLAGLEERMALLDGLFAAGPTPAGGFRVRAILPLPLDQPLAEPRPGPDDDAESPGREAP